MRTKPIEFSTQQTLGSWRNDIGKSHLSVTKNMVGRGKTVVLRVRQAIWCNLLTQAAKQGCEIFEFEPLAANLSFYALIWKLSRESSERTLGISYNVTNMEWSQKPDHYEALFRSDVFVAAALGLQFPIYPVERAALSFQHANPMWFICTARKFCVSNELLTFQSVSPLPNWSYERNCGLWVVHEGSEGAMVTGKTWHNLLCFK